MFSFFHDFTKYTKNISVPNLIFWQACGVQSRTQRNCQPVIFTSGLVYSVGISYTYLQRDQTSRDGQSTDPTSAPGKIDHMNLFSATQQFMQITFDSFKDNH